MKVAELKKALQQHGLKPEGGKAAMAAALSEVVERSALELKYGALSLPELKAVCEANAQLKGGTKPANPDPNPNLNLKSNPSPNPDPNP